MAVAMCGSFAPSGEYDIFDDFEAGNSERPATAGAPQFGVETTSYVIKCRALKRYGFRASASNRPTVTPSALPAPSSTLSESRSTDIESAFETAFARLARGSYGEQDAAWRIPGAVPWLLERVRREHDLDALSAASAVLAAAVGESTDSLRRVVQSLEFGGDANQIDVSLRALRWAPRAAVEPLASVARAYAEKLLNRDEEDLEEGARKLLKALSED